MCDEEIIAVRRVRHEISEECGHDVHKSRRLLRACRRTIEAERKEASKGTARRNPPKIAEDKAEVSIKP